MIKFTVTGRYVDTSAPRSQLYLTWDDWNDFSYLTVYGAIYIDDKGERHNLEGVKIAYIGMGIGERALGMNQTFTVLNDDFFSLGISEEYYEALNKLPLEIRDQILFGLRDIAKDPVLYERCIDEKVTQVSFLRNITPSTITGQYRRMCGGGAKLTAYQFRFNTGGGNSQPALSLSFVVRPRTLPPTNIQVLIGKNGVGKTYLLNQMVDSLIKNDHDPRDGQFVDLRTQRRYARFDNLVFVSFSAFDRSRPRMVHRRLNENIRFHDIGLRRTSATKGDSLAQEFLSALNACKIRPYKDRWLAAVSELQHDPIFRDGDIAGLVELPDTSATYRNMVKELFNSLSSGHKIVLLCITRIVQTVQEKTLVILDEPETHLHPPLLSLFMSILTDLLTTTNGVAIVATHSPVVLQEVPKSCVWALRRSGDLMKADRLAIESYGENVGRLTEEVFGLEVTFSGFYKQLNQHVQSGRSYGEIIEMYGGKLGMEARDILMGLVNERDHK